MISGFRGKYRFLSNFHPCSIEHSGILFRTVEHAFQAAKATNQADRLRISQCERPGKAKRLGRTIKLRSDWEEVKLKVMRELLDLKFAIPFLQIQLLATDAEELVETNDWHDIFYGVCDGTCPQGPHEPLGENQLGKLLMTVRNHIRG